MPPVSHSTESSATTTTNKDTRAAAARAYALQEHDNRYQTPPVRPTPPSTAVRSKSRTSSNMNTTTTCARRKITPTPAKHNDDELDDYARFVQSLGEDSALMASALETLLNDDDEEDFELTDLDDSDDDDDDEEDQDSTKVSPPQSPLPLTTSTTLDHDFYSELEAELSSLLEEDLEAAVSTLLATTTSSGATSKAPPPPPLPPQASPTSSPPTTPLRDAARGAPVVTTDQVQHLQSLLQRHSQLLLQNCVLSVRAARKQTLDDSSAEKIHGGETPEDLTEILDGAVGMLQDLDQNRKDAIRNYIQKLETTTTQRSLLPQLSNASNKRLTRSAFQTLQESTSAQTIFDIPGLVNLKQTFEIMDNSGKRDGMDILEPSTHAEACRMLLRQAGTKYEESFIPGARDVSELVCHAKEVFGDDFEPPTTIAQQVQLRKNRNVFTAAEDNLLLRGVNLYGEKQWMLIADRYLPDRSVNIISQRYSKLCLLLYKAHGINIDEQGNLDTPPRFESVEQLDEEAISKLKKVEPPAILNVHRWSIEEDLTLLKAVPLLGHMWAELSTRLVPHRDRGHLRKRYQVLERRVKATVTRAKRGGGGDVPAPKRTVPTTTTTTTRPPTVAKKKKDGKIVLELGSLKQKPETAIIRGPMPAHLLCPTNANAKHPGAKMMRKVVSQLPRRPTSRDGDAATAADKVNGGPLSLPGPEFDTSRDASKFEKILNETSNDWSQLSRMKKMMENDTESMVADAIVTQLANGATKDLPQSRNEAGKEIARLPNMEIDSKSSSGLSMLNSTRDAPDTHKSPSTPRRKQNGGSIMASVMERTRKDPPRNDSDEHDNRASMAMEAPPPVPLTPSQPLQRFPSFGTPLGISPGPGMRSFFSPGVRHGQSPGLKSCFSPAAINSMMFGPGVTGADDYDLLPLELTEASRQALEDNDGSAKPMPLSSPSHPHTPSNVDMFHDSSHGLKATDLDAISALNSLSNSPAKFLRKRPSSAMGGSEGADNQSSSGSKSLFAAVVGGVEKKESSRKKRRK